MSPLVQFVLRVRRTARAVAPLTFALALGCVVVLDAAGQLAVPYAAVALAALIALLILRARKRRSAAEASALLDIEIGVPLLVGAYAAVMYIDGSLSGRAYPIVFLCIALVSAFARPAASFVVVAGAAALEVAIRVFALGGAPPLEVGAHLLFMLVFAALNATVLRAEIARARKASRSRLKAEIDRLRDDARSYRLLGAPATSRNGSGSAVASAGRPDDEERLARSGVEEIHQSVLFALRLLRETLKLHTAMLLWENDAGTHLKISELASDAQNLSEGPFSTGDGVFGAVIAQRTAVSFAGLKPSYKLPYYVGPCPVRAVCALPVFEHGALRGMLVVDRVEDRPFSDGERALVEEASRYAVRTIQNERVFAQLERAKVEQGKLYRAAETLGAATTESSVVDAGVKSAREIASVDFAAVTLYDEAAKMHEIRAVSGDGAGDIAGQRFRHNSGLVSMVLQNRHPLPYRGEYDEKRQVVFTRKVLPPPMPSIVVLPLLVHDRPLGTLVLGSRRRGAFNDTVRSTLEVLASHMAVSLSNARMMRRLEELATMDGLTGLLNKRAMLEVADQKLTAARRFGRRMSVLVTDIDHFKKVNDTHGHDAGDVIIKGLGEILRRAKRNTDAVARFGGEEFVIICEETDARGAMLLAERVREELGRTTFHVPGKPSAPNGIQVTCSIGVSTFPDCGDTWDDLFKAADEALYVSKRSGRNRSTVSSAGAYGAGARSSRADAPSSSLMRTTNAPASSGAHGPAPSVGPSGRSGGGGAAGLGVGSGGGAGGGAAPMSGKAHSAA